METPFIAAVQLQTVVMEFESRGCLPGKKDITKKIYIYIVGCIMGNVGFSFFFFCSLTHTRDQIQDIFTSAALMTDECLL